MLRRIERLFVQINAFLVGSLLFVMFLLVFANVITRYVLGFSMNWAEELSRYLMIWTTFLGAGLALRNGRHVAIEVLQDLLPRRAVRYLRALVGLLILAFMGVLAVLGYQYAAFALDQQTPVLRLSFGWVYAAIPLGAATFILHLVTTFRDYMEGVPAEGDLPSEPPAAQGGMEA